VDIQVVLRYLVAIKKHLMQLMGFI